MAKVTAPLLSFGSRGQIGKAITFSKWRGIDYAKQYAAPANPNTTAQQLTRDIFRTLNTMWVLAGPLLVAPWFAFATGRPFTDRNAFVGQNLRDLRGEADMALFIGSPGARGGLPPTSVTASTGTGTGEIDVAAVNPAAPTDWTLLSFIAVGFPDQAPEAGFGGPLVEGEDTATFNAVTLAGFPAATLINVVGYLQWQKPSGETAYSVSILDQATSGA